MVLTRILFIRSQTDKLPTIRLIDGREALVMSLYASSDMVMEKKYRSGQIRE